MDDNLHAAVTAAPPQEQRALAVSVDDPSVPKGKGLSWSEDKNVVLARAAVAVRTDPAIGRGMTSAEMGRRIRKHLLHDNSRPRKHAPRGIRALLIHGDGMEVPPRLASSSGRIYGGNVPSLNAVWNASME